ncbi:MAG: hypothetical protein PUA75_04420 [Clostridiales bacterium]|nr:hypothetical protein [Clostridiales bacterium]
MQMNTSLVKIWLLVFALQFVSDLVTKKNYGFSEIWMIICFGLLFRAWSRMEKPEELLEDFAYSILILNVINILYFCFGDKELYFDGRPTGTWSNPNPFSIGMVLCQAVMLFLLYRAAKEKRKWYAYVLPGVEFAFNMWMIYESQCRTAWLALALMLLWFGVYLIAGKVHVSKKRFIIGVVCGTLFLAAGGIWVILHSEAALSQRNIDVTSLNGITSGRIWIWKEYISHMNLFGHEKYLVVGDKNWFAHNGIVKNFYKFGLLEGIAHLIMLIEIVIASFQYWMKNKSDSYTVFVMTVLIAYLVPSMMESIDELPMVWVGWFAFYFMIGYLMQENGNRKQKNGKCE